ncbi:hypothetical protein [Flavobacterium selenitireducens]|uniref:hypothetical protein n=1 Tax=Flavobacterium selenitireducens TaxID=2722704 RepID=UPI00168B84E2|nr:hypothetical protein [Flavobacterium selenitireducens]MBD3582643.1 hypothetical protein [Flavobacterium selenitireducens]
MESEFLTFERFTHKHAAQALAKFFEENGIDYVVTDESPNLDSSFTGNSENEFRVKLKPEDFERAHKLLEDSVLGDLEDLPQDYYLYSFSDKELFDVVSAKDEWSAFDFMLARKILKDRGKSVSEQELSEMNKARIEALSQPDKPDGFLNFIGWISVILGGVLGLLIGWYLSSHRKTLPNGQSVFAFSATDRNKGKAMFRWSIVSVIAWIAIWGYVNYQP